MIFDYPKPRTERRHHPSGYASYESYRPWLRDEFVFRCIYCLKRETWGQMMGDFELDHFEPQASNPQRQLDYLNLVYACRRCNSIKSDQAVNDPFYLLHLENVTTFSDGSLQPQSREAERLIRQLDLNSPRLKKWRSMWMRIVVLAEERDRDLYFQIVGFPNDLPNLGRLRPPQNSRDNGLKQCWFARQQRGELSESY